MRPWDVLIERLTPTPYYLPARIFIYTLPRVKRYCRVEYQLSIHYHTNVILSCLIYPSKSSLWIQYISWTRWVIGAEIAWHKYRLFRAERVHTVKNCTINIVPCVPIFTCGWFCSRAKVSIVLIPHRIFFPCNKSVKLRRCIVTKGPKTSMFEDIYMRHKELTLSTAS